MNTYATFNENQVQDLIVLLKEAKKKSLRQIGEALDKEVDRMSKGPTGRFSMELIGPDEEELGLDELREELSDYDDDYDEADLE